VPAPTTFHAVLADRLRHDPGRPLVTFYDESTGERVELSVTTYANWVAKASSLLVDELGLEKGDEIRVDLPAHWLTTVFLGAAWNAGLVVSDDDEPHVAVCGPGTLATWAPRTGTTEVLACSLLPLGVRFKEALPAGVRDVGVEIWSQPDAFAPYDPPTPDDAATDLAGATATQAQLIGAAAAGSLLTGGDRLLSTANPASPPAIATFLEPLVKGGSLVLVAQADGPRLEAINLAERATDRFPA
jgi:uncharacterized protein (TIGR03089 family)